MSMELTLPDLSCGHCVRTVTETLQALDPQCSVQADLSTRRVHIDTHLSAQVVLDALSAEGYPAASPSNLSQS